MADYTVGRAQYPGEETAFDRLKKALRAMGTNRLGTQVTAPTAQSVAGRSAIPPSVATPPMPAGNFSGPQFTGEGMNAPLPTSATPMSPGGTRTDDIRAAYALATAGRQPGAPTPPRPPRPPRPAVTPPTPVAAAVPPVPAVPPTGPTADALAEQRDRFGNLVADLSGSRITEEEAKALEAEAAGFAPPNRRMDAASQLARGISGGMQGYLGKEARGKRTEFGTKVSEALRRYREGKSKPGDAALLSNEAIGFVPDPNNPYRDDLDGPMPLPEDTGLPNDFGPFLGD
jgi:hypothetical protein